MRALDAYERALSCCRENRISDPPALEVAIVRPVDELSAHQRKDCSTMVSLVDFMQIILRACQKPFGTPLVYKVCKVEPLVLKVHKVR